MAEVALRSVVKRYDEVEAVRSIDLDIPDNEFVFLTAGSGPRKGNDLAYKAFLTVFKSWPKDGPTAFYLRWLAANPGWDGSPIPQA